jgi:hypothetical protein
MKIPVLVLCLQFIFVSTMFCQNDSVTSVDHSKITLSTDIIPQWNLQVEIGGSSLYSESQNTYDAGTFMEYSVSSYSLATDMPALAFRLGIIKNVELRLGVVFKQLQTGYCYKGNILYNGSSRYGIYAGGPIEAGAKVKFLEESKLFPAAALNVKLYIPAGDFYFHMDYVSPSFTLMLKKDITKRVSIGANAGYGWNVYEHYTEKYGNYSVSGSINVIKRLNVFLEAYSYFLYKHTPDHRMGGGITFQFARNVMVVLAGGFGLSDRSPDLYGSGAIGFRFPD